MLRQKNWKPDNRRSGIRTNGDGLSFWNKEWNKPGGHKLVRLTCHTHLHVSFYNKVIAINNIFSSEKCESGWRIGFFVLVAIFPLALAAVVFVMKNKRCRPCNKESSGKDEKGKSVDLKNSNSINTVDKHSIYTFVFPH